MRIVILAKGQQGPGMVGGVQSYLRRLASGLKTLGHEVVFELAGDAPGAQAAHVHPDAASALAAALHRRPEVLQTTFSLGPQVLARAWPAFRRVEHRVGAHFVHPPRPGIHVSPGGAADKLYWAAYRTAYSASLVPSPRLRDAVASWGRPVLVPPAAVADHYAVRRQPPEGPVRFGYAGRLAADKGLEDVVAAFDGLAKTHGERVRLDVFGYGPAADVASLERRSHLHVERLEPDPVWTPERSSALTAFLSRIDVLVLPYRDLGMTVDIPLMVVEGMAAGCAVVSSAVADVPWVLGPAAPTVPPGDVAALERVLGTFVDEPAKARELGILLRQRAKEWDLTPEGAARAYVKGLGLG